MSEIGGYFGLELGSGSEFHSKAIRLNSGRSCLSYLLAAAVVERLYLPKYLCDALVDVIRSSDVDCHFYSIDESLEIVDRIELRQQDRLLYVNYFGLKNRYVKTLAQRYKESLIIDNSQAFFANPLVGVDTFYSPRKFFGVADGGYLYTDKALAVQLETASSAQNALHLLGRIDNGAQNWYQTYLRAEKAIGKQGLMHMSQLSRSLLEAVNYDSVLDKRNSNYDYLHEKLSVLNRFELANSKVEGPMIYPFIGDTKALLRETLLRESVYIATYWQEVLMRERITPVERRLVENFMPLPVDQRYDIGDMQRIVRIIKENIDE